MQSQSKDENEPNPGYAFTRPKRAVDRIFLHCSASDRPEHDDVEIMRRWHTDPRPKGRGWADVGYHLFIKKGGTVQDGRSLERTPAAQRGANTRTIAICLHGLKAENFTHAQRESLVALCKQIDEAYSGNVTFHGHREVAAKACPVFDYQSWLNLDWRGRPRWELADDSIVADQTEPKLLPVLYLNDHGDAVVLLQKLLNRELPLEDALPVDGTFGQATGETVSRLQQLAGLRPDRIVGPKTWSTFA